MTLMTDKQYVQWGGSCCPRCRNTKIEAGPLSADGPQAWSKVECKTCGYEWREVYTLSFYEEIE